MKTFLTILVITGFIFLVNIVFTYVSVWLGTILYIAGAIATIVIIQRQNK